MDSLKEFWRIAEISSASSRQLRFQFDFLTTRFPFRKEECGQNSI